MTILEPISKYKIVEKLEETNYAVINLLKTPNQEKLIQKKSYDNSVQLNELISREYQILSQFKHPNIVRVFDYDVDPEGRAYFTCEFIEGVPVNQVLKVFSEEFARAFLQVLNALAAFHNKGFVHSDLKPEHILYDSIREKVTIIDFGFAAVSSCDMPAAGTVRYVAPEVLKGIGIDQRSDLYSLGMIMYEILSGTKAVKSFKTLTSVPEELNNYLNRLAAPEPCIRPAIPELHEYLRRCIKGDRLETIDYDTDLPITGYVEIPEISLKIINAGAKPFIICGDTGTGKTRHLKELKYKLQTNGYKVLMHIGRGSISFLDTCVHFFGMNEIDILREHKLQIFEEIRQAILSHASTTMLAVMVDDLDHRRMKSSVFIVMVSFP